MFTLKYRTIRRYQYRHCTRYPDNDLADMAAKYPEEDNAEDFSKNQGQDQALHLLCIPAEANTQVLDESASDVEDNQDFRASQVATVYSRSYSEGSDSSNGQGSLNIDSSNFSKLFLLSTNICQDVMREILRKKNPLGPTDADLHNTICGSNALRKNVQSHTGEEMLLFPNNGDTVRYEQLDFTAMYKVARYALPKHIAPNEKWSAAPKPGAKGLMSSIEKLRLFRNHCSHSPSGSINSADFQTKVDEVTDVILEIERLLHTPNKFTQRVRRLTKASMSPRVTELEAKSVNLEKQIDDLKKSQEKSQAQQTGITDLFEEWKKHQKELLKVHSKLEELYKASSADPEEPVPLLQRNLSEDSIGDTMRDVLEESQEDEQFFVETKGTETAKKTLFENNSVIIAGRKGNGIVRLAHHLLFSLMSQSECQTHIVDSMHAVRECVKKKSHETVIVLLHDVIIDTKTKSLIKNLGKDIFKKSSNKYLIITSLNTTHLVSLPNVVNLSTKAFQLSTQEKQNMLRSHLDRCSKETFVSRARLNEREINEIANIKCSLEFPLACSLFTTEERYYLKGANFFLYPIDYFLGEIKCLAENVGYSIFFDLLVQQDESSPLSFVNDNHGNVFDQRDIKAKLEDENLDISDLAEIGEDLSRQGILIHRIPHTQKAFAFSNETVEQAAHILLLETNFTNASNILSSDALVRCVIVNPGLVECCLFQMNSKDQNRVAQKVLNDILSQKVSDNIWHSNPAIWCDKDFVDVFVRILFERLENERDHRVVVSSILTTCAQNRLLVLCKAMVKALKMCHYLSDDCGRLVSQTLLDACRIKGNIAIVEELVNYGADSSFCKQCKKESEAKHKCPLDCAVEANDQDAVQFLLQSGATIPHSKWKFWDFLKVAAEQQDTFVCNVPFVRILSICWKSKATTVNSKIEEFIERALKLNPDREFDRSKFFFDCLLLIGINDSLYSSFITTMFHDGKLPIGDQGENACHMVLESFVDPEMEIRVLATLANKEFEMLNEKDNSGCTPLAKAVNLKKSNTILSQMLLQNANADATDCNGRTALHLAILSPHPDEWVLNYVNTLAGPNIRCKDITGATPVQLCISKGCHRSNTLRRLLEILRKEKPLPTSLFHDCTDSSLPEEEMLEIMLILKEFDADPNTEDDTKSKPIAKAVKRMYLKIVNTLLDWNADVEDIDSQQNTLLHYCCYVDTQNGVSILDAFCRHHATNATTINRRNTTGRHAIMAYLAEPAMGSSSSIIVWRLLNMEPDLSIQDVEENTALHYLMQSMLTDDEVLNFTQVMVNDFQISFAIRNARDLSPLMLAFTAKKSRFNTVKFILSLHERVVHQTHLQTGGMGVLQHCITSCMTDDEVHEISQMLIQQLGISTNKPDITGLSPLFTSIRHSRSRCKTTALMLKSSTGQLCTGVLSELIRHERLEPDVVDAMHRANIPVFKIADQIGDSVFHFLIQNACHIPTFHDLVVSFLPFGHNINHVDSEGLSPLFHACKKNCPEQIVYSLLSNGARVHMSTRKESALHLCVRSKRNDLETRNVVITLVNSNGVDINAVDAYHTTALAAAVSQGKLLTAKELLDNGADPNIPDRENKTALHHCIAGSWSDKKTCEFLQLLLPTSQIDRKDGDARSALDIAASHVSFSRIFSILSLLTEGCEIKTVDRLGRSPLHNTVRCLTGQLACCKLERLCRIYVFLHFHMSPICKDDDGETAIDACTRENLRDEFGLLNKKQMPLGICEDILSMLQLGEVKSAPVSLTFTEDIGAKALNENMYKTLQEVACRLHEVNISTC